jgi:hypothetical protein
MAIATDVPDKVKEDINKTTNQENLEDEIVLILGKGKDGRHHWCVYDGNWEVIVDEKGLLPNDTRKDVIAMMLETVRYMTIGTHGKTIKEE